MCNGLSAACCAYRRTLLGALERVIRTRGPFKPGAPMPNRIQKHRQSAFERQQGRCFYCQHPMWVRNIRTFAIEHAISLNTSRRYRCTAEHLIAKQDGGRDNKSNIAAACIRCNQGRHQLLDPPSAEQYRDLVRHQSKFKKQ